jgi:hypothetical protein
LVDTTPSLVLEPADPKLNTGSLEQITNLVLNLSPKLMPKQFASAGIHNKYNIFLPFHIFSVGWNGNFHLHPKTEQDKT